MLPGKTKVAITEEDRLRPAYRTEMRQLAAKRFPYSMGLFLLFNEIACFLEQRFFPERGVDPISGISPMLLLEPRLFSYSSLLRVRLWR